MRKVKIYTVKFITFMLLLFVLSSKVVIAAPIATETSNTNDLMAQLLGKGVKAENVSIKGDNRQIGIFSGAKDIVEFDSGIVLSTGYAKEVFNDNFYIENLNGLGDPDLELINGGFESHDAISLEFDIVSSTDKLSFKYLFASNEWGEPSKYNDSFGLFVNGVNKAIIPNSNNPVNIQSILSASGYEGGTKITPATNGYLINTENVNDFKFNGRTVVLSCEAAVTPGQVNHVKICMGDTSDFSCDSAIFLMGGSLTGEDNPDTGDINLSLISATTVSSAAGIALVSRKFRKKHYK